MNDQPDRANREVECIQRLGDALLGLDADGQRRALVWAWDRFVARTYPRPPTVICWNCQAEVRLSPER